MSEQEILETAIKKSIDQGWDILERSERNGFSVQEDAYGYLFVSWSEHDDEEDAFAQSYMEVIYNQDFARALWPGVYTKSQYEQLEPPRSVHPWQYHLQRMVIAPNPIAYLGANL